MLTLAEGSGDKKTSCGEDLVGMLRSLYIQRCQTDPRSQSPISHSAGNGSTPTVMQDAVGSRNSSAGGAKLKQKIKVLADFPGEDIPDSCLTKTAEVRVILIVLMVTRYSGLMDEIFLGWGRPEFFGGEAENFLGGEGGGGLKLFVSEKPAHQNNVLRGKIFLGYRGEGGR